MATEEAVYIDLRKLKMTELRKELQDRGLKISGNKQELVDRLQQYMEEHEGAEVADDDILKEVGEVDDPLTEDQKIEDVSLTSDKEQEKTVDTNPSQIPVTDEDTKPTENNVSDLQSAASITDEERRKMRAEKFGLTVADMNPVARKAARTERFGTAATGGASAPNSDILKKRSERFGTVTKDAPNQSEDDERRRKRQARFGGDSSTVGVGDVDKKKKRAERFGLVA